MLGDGIAARAVEQGSSLIAISTPSQLAEGSLTTAGIVVYKAAQRRRKKMKRCVCSVLFAVLVCTVCLRARAEGWHNLGHDGTWFGDGSLAAACPAGEVVKQFYTQFAQTNWIYCGNSVTWRITPDASTQFWTAWTPMNGDPAGYKCHGQNGNQSGFAVTGFKTKFGVTSVRCTYVYLPALSFQCWWITGRFEHSSFDTGGDYSPYAGDGEFYNGFQFKAPPPQISPTLMTYYTIYPICSF